MQCTAHFKVLEDIFNFKVPQLQTSVILSSLFGVTPSILTEYHENLKSHQMFIDWFSASMQNRRFKTIRNCNNYLFPTITGINSDHFLAAFYSNQTLLYSCNQAVAESDMRTLTSWGVSAISATRVPTTNCAGDNPLLCVHLTNCGRKSPDFLKPYLAKEKNIIVYDKYVGTDTLEVIKSLIGVVDAHATVTIVKTNGVNGVNAATILANIKAISPTLTVNVHTASRKTAQELHDRYIFSGDRYVIKFTKGIDCFYKFRGVWLNKIGDVTVEDNQNNYVNYSMELDGGGVIAVKLTN